MFKIGDVIYLTEDVGNIEQGCTGKVVDVLPEWLPYPYIVDFGFSGVAAMPCAAKEIALD